MKDKHFKDLQFNQLYKMNEKRQIKGTTQDIELRLPRIIYIYIYIYIYNIESETIRFTITI